MEPTLPEPVAQNNFNAVPEPQNQSVDVSSITPENAPNVVSKTSYESAPTPSQAIASAPQPVAAPAPIAPTQTSGQIDDQSTAEPLIADDVDVIEKEWVDKAKKIVSDTKHDPYQQEKEVSKLQADYLLKRYNKQVKLSE